jgi:predicted dinucleotide-binding enzyme
MQSILIVGAGAVGRALGANLLHLGHRVRYAVRDTASAVVPVGAEVSPVDGAAAHADLVVLAVPFGVVEQVVPRLALAAGQVLVDATNPFGAGTGDSPSGAAIVAAAAGDGVSVVKAFNVLGAEHMESPPLPDGHRPVLPVASDDPAARRLVSDLASAMGFDAVDVGSLGAAPLMEEAARYWGLLAFGGGRGRGLVLVAHQRP